MKKPKAFLISLSGNTSVYYAKSIVEGSVLLELTEPEKTEGILLVFSGKAHVEWTEHRSRGSNLVTVSDTKTVAKEVFIHLWGNGRDVQELAAGNYEFPFKFQLPDKLLPTSFESDKGYIRYSLFAMIKRSWIFDYITTTAITVHEIIDINKARLTTPLSRSVEKTLFCLCCASGPLFLSVEIDRGGYCPGESIAISTEAKNHTNRRVTGVQATLKQLVDYNAAGHHFSFWPWHKVIQRIEGPGIGPGSSSNWSNKLLPIPATVPTINSCRIINLSYELTVTINISSATDLHISLPIIIGNVPFEGGGSAPVSAITAAVSYSPPAETDPCTSSGSSFKYSSVHPPVNINPPIRLDRYIMGETLYAPVYVFVTDYQFAPPSSRHAKRVAIQSGKN